MYIYSLLTNVYHLHLLPLASSRFHLKSRGRIENQRRDRSPGLIVGLVRHKRNSSSLELDSFLITATLQPPPPLLPPPLPHSLSLSPRPFLSLQTSTSPRTISPEFVPKNLSHSTNQTGFISLPLVIQTQCISASRKATSLLICSNCNNLSSVWAFLGPKARSMPPYPLMPC